MESKSYRENHFGPLFYTNILVYVVSTVVVAIFTGVDWWLVVSMGALLTVSALALWVNSFNKPRVDFLVLGAAYSVAAVIVLCRFLNCGQWFSVIISMSCFVLPPIAASRSSLEGENPIVSYLFGALAGSVCALLLWALWRLILSRLFSFFVAFGKGIATGSFGLELVLLLWSVCAGTGTLAALATLATSRIRMSVGYMWNGTLDTAGQPNWRSMSRGYDERTIFMVIAICVAFLAAMATIVCKVFASAAYLQYLSGRGAAIVFGVPVFALHFGAAFRIPRLIWHYKNGDGLDPKREATIGICTSTGLLVVSALIAVLLGYMYVHRLN